MGSVEQPSRASARFMPVLPWRQWVGLVLLLLACAPRVPLKPGWEREGMGSYYGRELQGRRTANGEIFNPSDLTCAHPTLPFGSCVKVTVLDSGRSVKVRVNDRGPFVKGRIIDVSEGAARKLGMVGQGVARVRLSGCN
jgi:rare lipoprotein A